MEKRTQNIILIGHAVMAIKQTITKDEFNQIQEAHDIAKDHYFFGTYDDAYMFNYEHVVRMVAEDNDLTHLTDPILANLER